MTGAFKPFIGLPVVIDTDSDLIYMGTLAAVDENFVTLESADVHHARETATTRETYVMDSKKFGIRENRRQVKIIASRVVSISLLDDVVEY